MDPSYTLQPPPRPLAQTNTRNPHAFFNKQVLSVGWSNWSMAVRGVWTKSTQMCQFSFKGWVKKNTLESYIRIQLLNWNHPPQQIYWKVLKLLQTTEKTNSKTIDLYLRLHLLEETAPLMKLRSFKRVFRLSFFVSRWFFPISFIPRCLGGKRVAEMLVFVDSLQTCQGNSFYSV